jgi:folylpolyglutamate synthase/dihydropteroate synthase
VLNASLAVALVRSWEQTRLQNQQQQLQEQEQENGSGVANRAAAVANGSGAAAAVGSAAERLQQLQSGVLPLAYCEGLKAATWPGRSQVGWMESL